MENSAAKERCRVLEWRIDNFSCWTNEIHEKAIVSPKSQTTPAFTVKLYPRGLSGDDELLVVHLNCSRTFHGTMSFVGPDESVLCTQKVNSEEEKILLELTPGLKFEEVVAQIRKNEDLYRDRLIFRYQIRSPCDDIEHLHTTLYALDVSLKLYPEIFNPIKNTHNSISLLKYPLHKTESEPMVLEVSKNKTDHSRMVLTLNPDAYKKKFLVLTRMYVLSNEDVIRTEENGHLFRDENSWAFCNTLTQEEIEKEGFSLILYLKIIPKCDYKHSFGLYQYRPFKVDIVTVDRLKPLGTSASLNQFSKSLSTVASHEPDSSLTVLSSHLMCLFQDQDFSDFQLKCGDVTFPVHKNILSARSPVFKTMLSCDMREAASGCMDVEDLDPSTLALFLTYLYTGAVDDLQGESALKLYYAADKYQVPSLKVECVFVLRSSVSISNVCDILSLADKHKDDELTSVAHEFFLNNFSEVLASEGWKIFMRREPLLALDTVTHFGEKKCVGKVSSA